MFFELIATFVAGLAAAGLVLLLNHLLRGRIPRWLMPVAAGGAMLAVTIGGEYSWFERTRAALPEGFAVVETVENRALYRPWTYLAPFTERFVALDRANARTHPARPGHVLADVLFYARWQGVRHMVVLADCEGHRRAPVGSRARFSENGDVSGLNWVRAPREDALLAAMCAPEEGG